MDYNKNMKLVYYTLSKEIEIVEGEVSERKWHFYFKDKWELAELLNTCPELVKELIPLLEVK